MLSKFDAQNKVVHEIPVRWDYDDHVPYVDYELQPKNKNKRKINMVNETKEEKQLRERQLQKVLKAMPPEKELVAELEASTSVCSLYHVCCPVVEQEMNIVGAKRGMRSEARKMTQAKFHKEHGHIGTCSGEKCEICIRKRGNCFKLHPLDLSYYSEHRPGFKWLLDCITWDHLNARGEKYSFVLRDVASGYFKIINASKRDEFRYLFENWVDEVRKSSHMQTHMHTIVGEILCDFDGVFREDSVAFQKLIKKLGIDVTYVPPEHHEGPGERAMGILEETTKACLMERNLEPSWWGECTLAAEFLLNRFALTRDTKSSDGDAVRPVEKLTDGHYPRRRIDKELSYYIGPGTLALVYDNRVKGSDVSAKVRFGVAIGMVSDIVLFKCPYTNSKFRSKSYTVVELPNSVSYTQFLNMPTPKQNKNCMQNMKNVKINIKEKQWLSALPEPRAWEEDRLRNIKFLDRVNDGDDTFVTEGEEEGDGDFGREYTLEIGGKEGEGEGLTTIQPLPLGKQVAYQESKTTKLKLDGKQLPQKDYEGNGEYYCAREVVKEFRGVPYRGIVTNWDTDSKSGGEIWEITYEDGDVEDLIHSELMEVLQPNLEGVDREERGEGDFEKPATNANTLSPNPPQKADEYISNDRDTFSQICRERFNMRDSMQMKMYWKCLDKEIRNNVGYPFAKGKRNARENRVGEGIHFPSPLSLPAFVQLRQKTWKENFRETPRKMMREAEEMAALIAMKGTVRRETLKYMAGVVSREKNDGGEKMIEPSEVFLVEKSTGKIVAPERVQDAIDRGDLELWLTAWNDELDGLSMEGEHITHNHTWEEVLAFGIKEPALPTRMISAAKYRGAEFDRRKGRLICQGFRAIEGVHHDGKTFAASPSQYTQKVLMSFVAGKGYKVKSWDIKTAYLFGERVKPVALSYPVGFRRTRDGKELFMIARRGHYGELNAGRMWAETRTKNVLKMYNSDKWSVHICKTDPCLNVVTYWPKGKPAGFRWCENDGGELSPEGDILPPVVCKTIQQVEDLGGVVSYLSIYTDDIDAVGPDEEVLAKIYEVMNKVWTCKVVPNDFMLGVKRDIFVENGVRKVRMSQPAFFEDAFAEFHTYTKPYLDKKPFPKIPLPTDTVINKSMAGETEEERKEVLEVGYAKLAGCILWGARGCCPESLWAASQVCSLMSCPSWKAWKFAIGVLAYQYSVRKRGILFSGDGNDEPILLADASFKIDPYTGKTQYGTVAMLYGGPVIAVSKKIPYVALSTPHAELCAMNYAARTAAWLKNLFEEMGHAFKRKTLLLGDNTVAVLNSTEDVVSEKNKYIQLSFHYVKERKEYLDIHHIRTSLMLADILTKSVSRQVFECLVGWFTGTGETLFTFIPPKPFK